MTPKPVLETYVRETSKLAHLTVSGETIFSTFDHPYYVKDKGFTNAVNLCIGSQFVDNSVIIFEAKQSHSEMNFDNILPK